MLYCDDTLYFDDDMPEYVIASVILPGRLKIIVTHLTYPVWNKTVRDGEMITHVQADLWRTDHEGHTTGAAPIDRVVGVGAFIEILGLYMLCWMPNLDQLTLD